MTNTPIPQPPQEESDATRLSHRVDMLQSITRGVSHDIANLLTVILGQCRLTARAAESGELPRDRVLKAFSAVEQNAERIRGAIDALRYYARAGADDPTQLMPLDLAVVTAVTLARNSLDRNSIAIDIVPADQPMSVVGTRSAITRLVTDAVYTTVLAAAKHRCDHVRLETHRSADHRATLDLIVQCASADCVCLNSQGLRDMAANTNVLMEIIPSDGKSTLRLVFPS